MLAWPAAHHLFLLRLSLARFPASLIAVVFTVAIIEALLLSMGGAIVGIILAGIAMLILSGVFWGLDSPIFLLLKNGYMTFKLIPLQVLLHFSVVAGLTILAAFIPARRAALMSPVEALRST